jgi:hypothetical protein
MDKVFRALAGLIGLLFVIMGVRWVIDPAGAAGAIGLPVLEGLALSSQIGDLGAFFFAGGAMALFGAWKQKAAWYLAPALLIGTAAVFRILAALVQDATMAPQMIIPELVMTGILLMAARTAD